MREVLVNEQALIQAANFVVGEQATNAIINLYQMIYTTQKHTYDQGVLQGQEDAEQATADAWDAGYDKGWTDGMDTGWADGMDTMTGDAYIQGVADARARPETADERVAYLSEKSLLDAAEDDEFEDKDVCPICGFRSCDGI